MPYTSLTDFIATLEKHGELLRISAFVSPQLEIAEITDRFSKHNGPALLFENTGTEFPVLINAFGSEKRICLALGVENLDQVQKDIEDLFKKFASPKNSWLHKLKMLPMLSQLSGWMPKSLSRKGACQQVVMPQPDITKLPVLKCWPHDGGPFVTLPVVHTKDPANGTRNVGMYRMQVFEPTLTGMHWHMHKNSARHYQQYKKLGQRMPVSVTLGGDPVYTYAATAPLPDNFDEYILAGFLRRKKVSLVKCLTNDLEVPEDVDFVIEGYVDTSENMIVEGPFGDHTGFYSLADLYPRFHITCITHRKNAVYPATIVGIPPQEDAWIGKATERIFLGPIRLTMHPDIVDIHMPVEGVFHNLVLFKTHPYYDGQALKIINGLWGAGQMMFTKVIIAVDMPAQLTGYRWLAKYISDHVNVADDIIFSKGPSDVLDHASAKYAFGSKIGIDACAKAFRKAEVMTPSIQTVEIKTRFPEIKNINISLLQAGISLVVLGIEKNKANHIADLCPVLIPDYICEIKFVVFTDSNTDVDDLPQVAWLVLNNIDPERDIFRLNQTLLIDGTAKTKEFDHFDRPWPNVIVSSDKTIQDVDAQWTQLGLGAFIESPSLKYKKLLGKGGACRTQE
ncbi:MAG: menaquinone biosynthesis decarboxylase [Bacteroidota bacterium]